MTSPKSWTLAPINSAPFLTKLEKCSLWGRVSLPIIIWEGDCISIESEAIILLRTECISSIDSAFANSSANGSH